MGCCSSSNGERNVVTEKSPAPSAVVSKQVSAAGPTNADDLKQTSDDPNKQQIIELIGRLQQNLNVILSNATDEEKEDINNQFKVITDNVNSMNNGKELEQIKSKLELVQDNTVSNAQGILGMISGVGIIMQGIGMSTGESEAAGPGIILNGLAKTISEGFGLWGNSPTVADQLVDALKQLVNEIKDIIAEQYYRELENAANAEFHLLQSVLSNLSTLSKYSLKDKDITIENGKTGMEYWDNITSRGEVGAKIKTWFATVHSAIINNLFNDYFYNHTDQWNLDNGNISTYSHAYSVLSGWFCQLGILYYVINASFQGILYQWRHKYPKHFKLSFDTNADEYITERNIHKSYLLDIFKIKKENNKIGLYTLLADSIQYNNGNASYAKNYLSITEICPNQDYLPAFPIIMAPNSSDSNNPFFPYLPNIDENKTKISLWHSALLWGDQGFNPDWSYVNNMRYEQDRRILINFIPAGNFNNGKPFSSYLNGGFSKDDGAQTTFAIIIDSIGVGNLAICELSSSGSVWMGGFGGSNHDSAFRLGWPQTWTNRL